MRATNTACSNCPIVSTASVYIVDIKTRMSSAVHGKGRRDGLVLASARVTR
jgi:hypothetical protein